MTDKQEPAKRFENFLMEYMTQAGMTCTREPELPDGKTPDFLVEHNGKRCYIEATITEQPEDLKIRQGEEDLKKLLDQHPANGWIICFSHPPTEKRRLTSPLGRGDGAVRKIPAWLKELRRNNHSGKAARIFKIKGVKIEATALEQESDIRQQAGTLGQASTWIRGGLIDVKEKHEKLRAKLKEKYDKYTDSQESLGNIPLIIAMLDSEECQITLFDAIYMERIPYIKFDGETNETLETGVNLIPLGIWLNNRPDGKHLRQRHNHLAAVWHFVNLENGNPPPVLYTNPFREDLKDIIPPPLLQERQPTHLWEQGRLITEPPAQ